MTALDEWRDALASWALPDHIVASAPCSPWTYPWELFRRRAEAALSGPKTPSAERTLEALPDAGSVIDVGSGPGAASLALVPRAGRIVAVDQSEEALALFDELATRAGVAHETVVGAWPDVAAEVEPADVVVCNHVLYNVTEFEPFVRELTAHARRRVVVEITDEHPRAEINFLWKRLHGLERPTRPTADDAERALAEIGVSPRREGWTLTRSAEERSAIVERLLMELALTPDREDELVAALGESLAEDADGWRVGADRKLVTLWWDTN